MNEVYVVNRKTGETTGMSAGKFNSSKLDRTKNLYLDDFEIKDWYGELTALRDSGVMNMMGASTWLVDNFDLSPGVAKTLFLSWAKSFDDER